MTFSHGLKFKMIDKISLSTMYVLAINGMKISMCFTDVIIISYAKNKILSTSKWTNGTGSFVSVPKDYNLCGLGEGPKGLHE